MSEPPINTYYQSGRTLPKAPYNTETEYEGGGRVQQNPDTD